jgi:uncharacterized SAM-binding protein YcdF (DUF218 family)
MIYLSFNSLCLLLGWGVFLGVELIVLLILLLLGVISLFIFLILESIKIWRLESHSLANLLVPLALIGYALMDRATDILQYLPPKYAWARSISGFYALFLVFIFWKFSVFLVSSLIYARKAPLTADNAKYFVVLGAGLVNGEQVGKLLAARIEKAVDSATDDTIILFSGGQGSDEKISEALAMQRYAVETLGFPKERTRLEDKSRTTYENLVFSSELLEHQPFSFFTSDYHVLRAAIFAKDLGLAAQGHGGKTALYYRLPAFIREFIAILNTKRKKYLIIFLALLILRLLIFLILNYLQTRG